MNELKPCPFCGGEAEIHPSNDWDATFTGATFFAWCDRCETRGDYYSTEEEAIKAWNTRAERTCKVDSVFCHEYEGGYSGFEYEYNFTCGDRFFWENDYPPDYCPWCGAKVVD